MFRSLLAAIKPVESQDYLVQYVADLAKLSGMEVEGCSVLDLSRLAPHESVPIGAMSFKVDRDLRVVGKSRESASENMCSLFEACRERMVPCEAHVCEGDTLQILLDAVQRTDLLVCGHAIKGDIGETSLLQALLKDLPRPALVVPEGEFGSRSVVIAFDGSVQAGRTLASFAHSGLARDRAVHVVSFGEDSPQAQKTAESASNFLQRHQIAATISIDKVRRDVASQILEAAAGVSADLLVIGAFGQSSVREFFLGSVTRSILNTLPIPVYLDH